MSFIQDNRSSPSNGASKRVHLVPTPRLPLSSVCLSLIFLLYPFFVIFWLRGVVILTLMSLVVTIATDTMINRRSLVYFKRVGLILMFYALPMVSFIWSQWPSDTLLRSIIPMMNFGLFYLSLHANWYSGGRSLVHLANWVPVYFCSISIAIFAMFGSFRNTSDHMAEILGSYANHSAAIAILCMPITLSQISLRSAGVNLPTISLIACILIAILSQSRAAMLLSIFVLVAYAVIFGANSIERLKKLARLLAIFVPVIALMVIGLGYESTIGGVVERTTSSQVGEVLLGDSLDAREADLARAAMYAFGLEMIYEYPVTGAGFGGLYHFMQERLAFGIVSHNLIITFWGELGLIGLVTLFYFFYRVPKDLADLRRQSGPDYVYKVMSAGCIVCILTFFLYGMTRPYHSNYMFPLVLGYVVHMLASWRLPTDKRSLRGMTVD